MVFEGEATGFQFLNNWERVQAFSGNTDIAFLHELLEGLAEHPYTLEELQKVLPHWTNSIQFTEPRASLLPMHTLLRRIADKYLVDVPLSEKEIP